MNPVLLAALINSALNFALNAAATLLEASKNSGATLDDAINALREAAATPLHLPPKAPPASPP